MWEKAQNEAAAFFCTLIMYPVDVLKFFSRQMQENFMIINSNSLVYRLHSVQCYVWNYSLVTAKLPSRPDAIKLDVQKLSFLILLKRACVQKICYGFDLLQNIKSQEFFSKQATRGPGT